jgi:hypothetical protein
VRRQIPTGKQEQNRKESEIMNQVNHKLVHPAAQKKSKKGW